MVVAPNHQKLVITKKTLPLSSGNYQTDMRTIEQWANEGIVRKLIAGSGVTLDPSSGVDAGNGIEISASGGAGGGTGLWQLTSGPDPASFGNPPFGVLLSGTSFPNSGGALGVSSWLTMDQPGAGPVGEYAFVNSWWWNFFGAQDVVTYPSLLVPAFTGTIKVSFTIMAAAPDFTDAAIWQTNPITAVSGTPIATTAASYVNNPEPPSGDLSLGTTGVETAGGDTYFAAGQAIIIVSAGTTFP